MKDDQSVLRTKRIIEHLEDLWQSLQEPSPEVMKRIIEFILDLQEPYRTLGIKKIADRTDSTMILHILDIMATFQQKAEQEGIFSEDRDETLEHILPQTFQILQDLSGHVSVLSLDDLAALSNITTRLQILSRANTAEEAQSWLYELPAIYYHQLAEENLVVNVPVSATVTTSPRFLDWRPYMTSQEPVQSVTIRVTITNGEPPTPEQLPIPLEKNKIHTTPAA